VLCAALLASALLSGSGVSAADTTIDASNLYFCAPALQGAVCETTISAGDTVTWQIVLGSHTVTECNDTFTVCPPAGGFDSGFLSGGATFAHQFNSTGGFEYWCALHPSLMRGRIIVQQAAPTPSPSPTPPPGSTPPLPPAVGGKAGLLIADTLSPTDDAATWNGSSADQTLVAGVVAGIGLLATLGAWSARGQIARVIISRRSSKR